MYSARRKVLDLDSLLRNPAEDEFKHDIEGCFEIEQSLIERFRTFFRLSKNNVPYFISNSGILVPCTPVILGDRLGNNLGVLVAAPSIRYELVEKARARAENQLKELISFLKERKAISFDLKGAREIYTTILKLIFSYINHPRALLYYFEEVREDAWKKRHYFYESSEKDAKQLLLFLENY